MLPDKKTFDGMVEFLDAVTRPLNRRRNRTEDASIAHYRDVARCAQILAKRLSLDEEKAYILGFLHDYGEFIERSFADTFHGTAGYDIMMQKGYDEVARVCLTHSFWEGIYDPNHFTYCKKEVARAEELIKKLQLDEYDYLIQMSDLLCCEYKFVTVEERLNYIIKTYNVPVEDALIKRQKAKKIKQEFDKKCGMDIYKLLEIK